MPGGQRPLFIKANAPYLLRPTRKAQGKGRRAQDHFVDANKMIDLAKGRKAQDK